MEPPPGRRMRLAVRLLAALSPLVLLSACIPGQVVPAAPVTTSETPRATPTASMTPSASTPSPTRPSGLPTYSPPAEAACVLPTDVPVSIRGAEGPTLTARRVEKAWRASEAGKSLGVTTGSLDQSVSAHAGPLAIVYMKGAPWVALDYMEWSSLMTIVMADPGVAAAKLEGVRAMVRQPCSYGSGPYSVGRITDDRPDLVVVTATMDKNLMTSTFIRYGNTVTYASMMLVPSNADELQSMVRTALTKA